jgi:hypothetical protein
MPGNPLVATLTRTSESTINQTQPPETVEWRDINISLDGPSVINYRLINLTRSSTPYHGENCPLEWGNVTIGDILEIGAYDSYLSVSMRWMPTDRYIGSWDFNYS